MYIQLNVILHRLDPLLVQKPLSGAKQTCITFAHDTKVCVNYILQYMCSAKVLKGIYVKFCGFDCTHESLPGQDLH